MFWNTHIGLRFFLFEGYSVVGKFEMAKML
jgi:hypothetical protein